MPWAYVLYAVAGLLLFVGLARLYAHRRNAALEANVAERTRSLTEAQAEAQLAVARLREALEELKSSEEKAQRAEKAKGEFLAHMSHEMRSPLTAVVGMTDLLLDTELAPDQRDFTETIRRSGDSLLNIVNEVLDLSKIEAGRMELEAVPFPLESALEEVLEMAAPKAFEKGLELVADVGESPPPTLVGDAGRLKQILLNLVGNAVKFTEQGEVVVTASVRVEGSSAEASFSVRDTGIGIPEDRLERIFVPFGQLGASTARRYGGTGLGLSISRRLTERMGGRMWVESVVGKGTTMMFTARFGVHDGVPEPLPTPVQRTLLEGLTALVFSRNETQRGILARLLARCGMTALFAASEEDALELFAGNEQIAVGLLDAKTWRDVAPLARDLTESRPAAPLLLLLGGVARQEKGDFSSSGFLKIHKPVRQARLFELLAAALGAAVIPRAGAAAAPAAGAHDLRLLTVDDDPVNLKVARLLLESLGYASDTAESGRDALRRLDRERYDLVLLDVMMPEMDGLEVTRRIRTELPAERQPRIVALSAGTMAGNPERCLAAGMDAFLAKPIVRDELDRLLSECANEKRQRTAGQ